MPRKKQFTLVEETRIAEIAAKLPEAPRACGGTARNNLLAWFRSIGVYVNEYRYHEMWGKLDDRILTEAATRRGYGRFACKTHGSLSCNVCACPSCGAPGGCDCRSRDYKEAHHNPRLPNKRAGVRRIGLELEVAVRDDIHRQKLFEEWPYCSDDGSLREGSAEMKFVGHADRIVELAEDLRRVLTIGGLVADERCGFHVHVERGSSVNDYFTYRIPAETWKTLDNGLIDRYIAEQEDLRSLFPSRLSTNYCHPVRLATNDDEYDRPRSDGGYGAIVDHYSALSYSQNHETWEFRLHPGTSSWLLASCWADWCASFVDAEEAVYGKHYIAARRAAKLATGGKTCYPWAWRRMLEARARKSGLSRTFRALASGEYATFENPDTLRVAAKEARVSIWADPSKIEVTPEYPEVSGDVDAAERVY